MNRVFAYFGSAFILFVVLFGFGTENLGAAENQYLGQKPPGDTPVIFAPGIVSSENQEHSSLAFSPDGKEMWWSLWRLPHDLDKYPQVIYFIRFDGEWSKPAIAPFSGLHRDGSPAFSPDGNRIYFYSRRPLKKNAEGMHDNDIWYAERSGGGWTEPVNLGNTVNSPFVEATPCLAGNGNLYFTSNRTQYEDPIGNPDLFVAEFVNGAFAEPEGLGTSINTSYAREGTPYIAPDESYIIFARDSRRFDAEGNKVGGERKLMISYKNNNGAWLDAVELGPAFYNTRFPSVSTDGKYLFFTKFTEGSNEDIYWVDAKIIDDLKPEIMD